MKKCMIVIMLSLVLGLGFVGCKAMQVQKDVPNVQGQPTVPIEDILGKIGGIMQAASPAVPVPLVGMIGAALGSLLVFGGHTLGNYARNKASSGTAVAATTALGGVLAAKGDLQSQIMTILAAVPSHATTDLVPKLQALFDAFNKKADIIQAVTGVASNLAKGV